MERFTSALIVLTLTSMPAGVGAQDTEWNRYTLEGLSGVFIRAESDPSCESAGVTASKLQADAAIQLLETDVAPLTRDEMLALTGLPELRITVECATGNGGSGPLGYSVSLRVQQAVKLIRNEQITLPEAVTWYSTAFGMADAGGAQEAVLTTLTSALEGFATAYAEANAEKEGAR